MNLVCEQAAGRIVLPVRVRAGAGRNGLSLGSDGVLRVHVTQIAERGKANRAVLTLLSKQLGLRKSQIELLAGATSPHKKFHISGCTLEQLRAAVAQAVPAPPGES